MKRKNLLLIHLLFWFIFILNIILQSHFKISETADPFNISNVMVNFLTFYLNYFVVIPNIMKSPRIDKFAVGFFLAFFFFIFLRYGIEEILFVKIIGHGNYFEGTTFSYYIFDNFYWGSNAVFISSLIWFLDYTFAKEKENQVLLKQKKEAELSLLKSQINPHFIFNTLNNIYSLVNQKSDKSLMAIEKLGDLLRYSGKELEKDFTDIGSEVNYLQNFIDLESLRLQNPENIRFKAEISNPNLKIAPMLLIPFVENAFKHGDLKNDILNIEIKNEGNELFFSQKNKISNNQKDTTSGIGIENVKKRLELLYPEKHTLKITNNSHFYEVNLKIEL